MIHYNELTIINEWARICAYLAARATLEPMRSRMKKNVEISFSIRRNEYVDQLVMEFEMNLDSKSKANQMR